MPGGQARDFAALLARQGLPYVHMQRMRGVRIDARKHRRPAFTYGLQLRGLQENQAEYCQLYMGGTYCRQRRRGRRAHSPWQWTLPGARATALYHACRPYLGPKSREIFDAWHAVIVAGRNMAGLRMRAAVLRLRNLLARQHPELPTPWLENWADLADLRPNS